MQKYNLFLYSFCVDIWCSPILNIPVSVMVIYGPDTQADFIPGTIATFNCTGERFGFSSGSIERTCGSRRIWSGSTPTCEGNLLTRLVVTAKVNQNEQCKACSIYTYLGVLVMPLTCSFEFLVQN